MKLIKIESDLFYRVVPLLVQKRGTEASNIIYEYLDKFDLSMDEKLRIHDEMMSNPNELGDFQEIFKIEIL